MVTAGSGGAAEVNGDHELDESDGVVDGTARIPTTGVARRHLPRAITAGKGSEQAIKEEPQS